MHRELTHADQAFGQESRLSLYLLTGFIGAIIAVDLWPYLTPFLDQLGLSLPTWPNEIRGYRIALIAALIGTARILHGSIDSLLQGRIGADLALAIASVAAILVREPLVAAELVFVGLLGECLENFTFERTRAALRKLAELTPRRCWRLRDGQEERILVSELQVGDQIVVKPGAKVPADGLILAGRSSVDVSPLTGESLPVERAPGDEVLAGSLNQQGALTIEARRVAEHTVLGRVIEMTARALKDRSPSERTADRLARWFLPIVLALAAFTFLVAFILHTRGFTRSADLPLPGVSAGIRYAVYPALSVLVVACPCALILATPAAVIAALGRLAGTGVLIKGGSVLERLARVDTFVFDKTGTLTEAKLELGDLIPLADISPEELLRLAASAEQPSEHPLARLLVEAARARSLTLDPTEDFLAHPGAGISVKLPSGRVVVGTRRLLEEQGVHLPEEAASTLGRLDATGQTVLLLACDGILLGAVGARDRIRGEVHAVLDELRTLGISRMVMLTGDRNAVAGNVAETLGLTEYRAELLPQDKAEFIAELQKQTPEQSARHVAMVGDGVNDAPALVTANVGLAIGGAGNDVAAEAGDVVLLIAPGQAGAGESARNPLRHLPLLMRLSRETVRIIRQNILVFAFGVNFVGIALTAWLWPWLAPAGWYESGPIAAVIYHQIGSLLVLLNSMRLLWFDRAASSPQWQQFNDNLKAVNAWLEKRFDIDEGLHWVGHNWIPVTATLSGLLLLGYACSGIYAIQPDEIGIVRQFGRALQTDLTPGFHWRRPWPFETVTRIQPERVRSLEIGFRVAPGYRLLPGSRSWSSAHGNDGLIREATEAVMITGDGNLLEVQCSVRYTVADPRVYLFEVSNPEKLLRNATESVLRDVVAGRAMADLLTSGRAGFQKEVTTRLRERCDQIRSGGIGLRLEGVALHDLHPPQEVVPAYHDVTQAMEQRDRYINEAQGDRIRRVKDQEARNLQIIRQAEAQRYERIRLAEARKMDFLLRSQTRNWLSWSDELILLLELNQGFLQRKPPREVFAEYQQKRRALIARQQSLTDFRLYWDKLTQSLAGRPKVLVDTDRLPGKRQLWLVPPQQPALNLPPAAVRRSGSEE